MNVADLVVARLHAWGVSRVFGYSGDGINGVVGALRRDGGLELVQSRHEENAALMAVGHAKYTGEVGVVMSTQGPGAVHLLNGLYDAKLDGVPLVAVVGQQARSALGSGYMQEVDLLSLVKDVAAQFAQQVSAPDQARLVVDRAFRTALATRSPTVVVLPHDVQEADAPDAEQEHGVVVTAPEWRRTRVLPHDADLQDAADLLAAGRRVALLVGQGARAAQQEVVAIADRLGAGITTSLLGKPFVDETLPHATGTMGHLGSTSSGHLLDGCDTLLIVGSNDPWTEFYPAPGQARAVQVDLDGRNVANRYPVEVGLVGDAAPTLRALLELLPAQPSEDQRSWRAEVEEQVKRWHDVRARRAAVEADPVNPEAVVAALDRRLPADAQVAVDVGSCVYWYARQLTLPRGVPAHVSGTLATMGCGVPYGIAAKLAHPDRPVVVLAGDGGFQMTGLAELVTISARWRDWVDPRFVVCVLDNRDLAEVSWEQREMEGEPRYPTSQELPAFPYADYARLLGLAGIEVRSPDELDDAWDRALSADRPCVLAVRTDPDVPLLPPFPAGATQAEQMRAALSQEGNGRALALLEAYVQIEA